MPYLDALSYRVLIGFCKIALDPTSPLTPCTLPESTLLLFAMKAYLRAARCLRPFSVSTCRRHDVAKLTAASADEMSHFNALASSWWDVNGPQRILHKMNLLRMDYINEIVKSHIKLNDGVSEEDEVYVPPYSVDILPKNIRKTILEEQEERRNEILEARPLRALDVGCGGGILSESLARLSYIESVKGIDLSEDVLEAARLHQKNDPALLNLTYELTAVEDLGDEKFDVVTVFEMLEHVQYPSRVLAEVLSRVDKGGWVFLSTINRDFVSWFTTIFMGEHVLGIVPVGTHTLEKYINESEIRDWVTLQKGFRVVDSRGCVYVPSCGWRFTEHPGVGNYFMAIQRVD